MVFAWIGRFDSYSRPSAQRHAAGGVGSVGGRRRPTRALLAALPALVGVGAILAPTNLAGQADPVPLLEGPAPVRPVPGPVVPPPFFQAAVARGTRSDDGRPGPGYWQPYTRTRIHARLDPATAEVTASATIEYENRSPVAQQILILNLYQNLHAPGSVRNEAQELTGGLRLQRVVVDGAELSEGAMSQGPAYLVDGTLMGVRPPQALAPGGTSTLEIEWSFLVPQSSAGRMGHSNQEMFLIAYWFPRPAVFDDLRGWDAEPYLSNAEFYDGFGDYSVSLEVPMGWTVMATGQLQNPDEVFTPTVLARLDEAAASDRVVRIASPAELAEGGVTQSPESGWLTYRFEAESVRDFTWTTSNVQTWDATSAVVPDRDGDGVEDRVLIHSFWRQHRAPGWEGQALFGKHAIEHHSRYTGYPYPWPHMTSVEGSDIIGGGMEFPMLTLIGGYDGQPPQNLYNVTSHEIAHMWIPMIVGTNERRNAWMDEGSTTFLEDEGRPDYWPGTNAHAIERDNYLEAARTGMEMPLMTHGDRYGPGFQYGTASYPKPATLLVTLRGLLGPEAFERAYRGFIEDWAFKHPSPWDLFNAFDREAGQDLDWFWQAWYFETWILDQSVASVEHPAEGPRITIEDLGFAPMPLLVRIETTQGGIVERRFGVDRWLRGDTTVEIQLAPDVGRVVRVEIDPENRFPDADRENNVWIGDRPGS